MKRRLAILVAGLLLGAMVVAFSAHVILNERIHTVTIELGDIEQALRRRLPLRREIEPGQDVVLKSSKIRLRWGSEPIPITTEFDVIEHGGDVFSGRVEWETGLRYDAGQATFFLRHPRIRGSSIRSMGARRLPVKAVDATIQALHSEVSVHQIRDEAVKRTLAKSTLKKVEWVDGRLVVSFGY